MPDHDTDDTDDGSTEETKHAGFKVPADQYERAMENAERGEFSERCREVVRDLAGDREGDPELNRLRDKRDDAIARRDEADRKIAEWESARDAEEAEIDRWNDAIAEREETIEECKAAYSDALDDLDASLRDGTHVFPEHGRVKDAAECHPEKTPQDVIADLKRRNPDLPDSRFEPMRSGML